eukprot:m51a1_g11886 hypothetical protein (648) ;mRNA; f:587517-589915
MSDPGEEIPWGLDRGDPVRPPRDLTNFTRILESLHETTTPAMQLAGAFPSASGFRRWQRDGEGGTGTWLSGLNVYTPAYVGRPDLEGDKVILPPSALEHLMGENASPPFLFSVRSCSKNTMVHCSVLEFTAPEGQAIIPFWMMNDLGEEEGATCAFKTVYLRRGSFVKFRPTTKEFYAVKNPKALLESLLGKFTALTMGSTIQVVDPGSKERIGLTVVELEPSQAVCILDTDVRVDFAPMEGAEDAGQQQQQMQDVSPAPAGGSLEFGGSETTPESAAPQAQDSADKKFVAFGGTGHKQTPEEQSSNDVVCGNCGNRVPEASYALHSLRCERFNKRCAKCGKVVPRAEADKHEQEVHALVPCPQCSHAIEVSQLGRHQAEECECRPMQCRYCDVSMPMREMPKHETYCGTRTEKCALCGKFVQKQHSLRHLESNCQFTGEAPPRRASPAVRLRESLVCCPGCRRPFERITDLEDHMAVCAGYQQSQADSRGQIFTCPMCNKGFISEVEVEMHIHEYHGAVLDEAPAAAAAAAAPADQAPSSVTATADYFPSAVGQYEDLLPKPHQEEPVTVCPLCDAHFKNDLDLELHISDKHGDALDAPQQGARAEGPAGAEPSRPAAQAGNSECPICGKIIEGVGKLTSHINSHF